MLPVDVDVELVPMIARAHAANYDAYGAAKVWDHLNRVEGVRVARCTVERSADLVNRCFAVPAPNRLWLADLTYVKTYSGWVYAAFVIDANSRRVRGWQASRSMRTGLARDALEMAVFASRRTGADLAGLTHHRDRGTDYVSTRYSQRPARPTRPRTHGARRFQRQAATGFALAMEECGAPIYAEQTLQRLA